MCKKHPHTLPRVLCKSYTQKLLLLLRSINHKTILSPKDTAIPERLAAF